jgi:hypothetical protein
MVGAEVAAAEKLESMVASQEHRGPDGCGIWKDSSGICHLDRNRLAIIDLSAAARQPMGSADGRWHIVVRSERGDHGRPLRTPQRQWLRGPLKAWASDQIEAALDEYAGLWLDGKVVRADWQDYVERGGDNSFFAWQWLSLGMRRAPC